MRARWNVRMLEYAAKVGICTNVGMCLECWNVRAAHSTNTFFFFGCGGFEFERWWLWLAPYALRFGWVSFIRGRHNSRMSWALCDLEFAPLLQRLSSSENKCGTAGRCDTFFYYDFSMLQSESAPIIHRPSNGRLWSSRALPSWAWGHCRPVQQNRQAQSESPGPCWYIYVKLHAMSKQFTSMSFRHSSWHRNLVIRTGHRNFIM